MKKVFITALLMVFAAAINVYPGAGSYGTAGIFDEGAGSRALAMGNAFTAVSDDSSAPFFNPAGLVYLPRQEMAFMHYPLYEGVLYNGAAYGQTVLGLGSIGAAVCRVYTGGITGYDADDFATEEFSYEEYRAVLSYAKKMNNGLAAGFSLTAVNLSMANTGSFGIGADAGLIYSPFDFLRLGLAVRNLMNPSLSLRSEKEDLPRVYTAGALFIIPAGPVETRAAVDAAFSAESGVRMRAGLEADAAKIFKLRCGYNDGAITFGGGAKIYGVAFDYAYVMNDYLGGLSRFTLSYEFGMDIAEQKAARRKELQKKVKELVEENLKEKERARAKKHYKTALSYYKRGKYSSALSRLEKAFEWDKDYKAAKQLEVKTKVKLVNIYFKRAIKNYKKNNYVSALEDFKKVIKTDPKNKTAARYIKKINKKMKLKSGAKKHFSDGVELYVNRQYKKALAEFKKALAADPGSRMVKSYISKARLNIKKSGRGGGLTAGQKEKVKELYYSGLKKYTKGSLEEAIAIWKKALKISPDNIKTLKSIERAQAELAELKKRGMK